MEKTPESTNEGIVAARTQLERELNGGESDDAQFFNELKRMINSGNPESVQAVEGILAYVKLPEEQESILRERIAKIKNQVVAGAITEAHAPVMDKLKGLIMEAGRQNAQKVLKASDEAQVAEAVAVLDDDDGEGGVQKIFPEQKKAALDQYDAFLRRDTAQQHTEAMPPPIPKETVAEPSKTPEEMTLDSARERYVMALHEYKKKKPMFDRMLDSLGIDVIKGGKKLLQPRVLVEAKQAYFEAKQKMNASVQKTQGFQTKKVGEGSGPQKNEASLLDQSVGAGDKVVVGGTEIEASGDFSRITFLDKASLELAEKEAEKLEEAMEKASTPLEKNILRKSLDAYRKVPIAVRVGLTSAVLGAASGAAVGAIAFGTTLKVGRAVGGAFAGKIVSNTLHHVFEKAHEKKKEEITSTYADVYSDTKETQEDDFLAALQKEIQKKKAEKVIKVGAAVAVGGAATLGPAVLENVPSTPPITHTIEVPEIKLSDLNGTDTPDPESIFDTPLKNEGVVETKVPVEHLSSDSVKTNFDSLKPKASVSGTPAPAVEQVAQHTAETGTPIRVELSSKGFIQTFEDMKGKLLEQYGSADKVPAQYKHFVETPSTKLAQEFGFYKPEEGVSGMGYAGEALTLRDGKLFYDTTGDKDPMLYDGTNKTADFEGKMFTPQVESTDMTQEDTSVDTDLVQEPTATVSKPEFNPDHTRIVTFSGKNITALNELFQNDVKFATIRTQFAEAFEVAAKEWGLPIQKTIPFEGGRVDIVQMSGKNTVLLNGEPFADGVFGGPIKLLSGKGSFWTETAYERAFKFGEVKEAIKQISAPKK